MITVETLSLELNQSTNQPWKTKAFSRRRVGLVSFPKEASLSPPLPAASVNLAWGIESKKGHQIYYLVGQPFVYGYVSFIKRFARYSTYSTAVIGKVWRKLDFSGKVIAVKAPKPPVLNSQLNHNRPGSNLRPLCLKTYIIMYSFTGWLDCHLYTCSALLQFSSVCPVDEGSKRTQQYTKPHGLKRQSTTKLTKQDFIKRPGWLCLEVDFIESRYISIGERQCLPVLVCKEITSVQ